MVHLLSINIITELSLWLSLLCVALGAGYAFFLYRKEEKFSETSPWLIKVMALSRFLLVSFLAFLLLSPFIKTLFNKVEKPVIIIAQDNTSSILLNKDSLFYKGKYLEELERLKTKLGEEYEVKTYIFGEDLIEESNVDFTEKITNLSNAFKEIENKYYSRNVGALILASDGIFNQGANPVFNSAIEFPVYTIALGDTALQRDIVLKEAIYNKLTFLGNKFPVEIDVKAYQCMGSLTELTITHNGTKLFSKQYNLNSNEFTSSENVLLEADEVGVQHYRIALANIDGEVSVVNNVKDIYIEVLDGRQNVLVLANSPHPDIKALKLSIENNENYKVTNQLITDFDGNSEPYSLVVLHQLPKVVTPSLSNLLESNVSVLYFLGNQSSMKLFNTIKTGLNIAGPNNRFNEIFPVVSDNFPLFTLSENTVKSLSQLPPVSGPFGEYKINDNGYALLNQKIGSVETTSPLMVFFQNKNKKVAVFAAEGIWKWRMQDFLRNKNHQSFDELINKTVQFLSVKEDKGKFRVFSENIFFENQEIRFDAELYNDSYELVNDPEINIDVIAENGTKYNFVFNRTTQAYILNAGILPSGIYTYAAKVSFGNKDYIENGKLQIKPLFLEANNTKANHQLLQNISQKFGGGLFFPNDLESLEKALMANKNIASVIYEENDLKEFINLKWIFFFLIALLSLEWFLRKRNGAY
jgi:hypothetical protein